MITILWGYKRASQNNIFCRAATNTLFDIYDIKTKETREPYGFRTTNVQIIFCDLNDPRTFNGKRADYVFGFPEGIGTMLLKNHIFNDQKVDLCELIYNLEKGQPHES